MAKRKSVYGKCRICGREGKLSFEHVPPRAAYNKKTVIEYTVESWIRRQSTKGKQQQGGIGKYTLCQKCNADTGSWYGSEYVRWADMAFDVLRILNKKPDVFAGRGIIAVTLKDVYPLRFLKQVITCLFSVVGVSPESHFAENNPNLQHFILNKYQTRLPDTYHFFLRLYQEPSKLRRHPIAGKITVTYRKDNKGNIIPETIRPQSRSIFSEMAHPPFALVMTQGTDFPEATDITHFKNYEYDECTDLVLPLKIGMGATPYPGHYQ